MKIPLVESIQLGNLKIQLINKVSDLRKAHRIELGCTSEPGAFGEADLENELQCRTNSDWISWLEPELSNYYKLLLKIMTENSVESGVAKGKIDSKNLWVWGGPTPYWGGSMAEDTLIEGADFYSAENIVYVYGPTDEKTLALHSKYKKMLCQINAACRTPGALTENSEEANAELLSKLSLKFPNIIGAICDDSTVGSADIVDEKNFAKRYAALKKYNSKLKMYSVIYAHELYKNFSRILPYVDVVNLWIWDMDQLLQTEEIISACQEKFPGKSIIAGIFLHEYGVTDAQNHPKLLTYQLDKIREFIYKDIVEGIIILGDREIKKWPTIANAVKQYLRE